MYNIFNTFKWLKKDKCWTKAKEKGNKVVVLTLLFYLPLIFIISILALIGGNFSRIALLLMALMFLSLIPFCDKILKPFVDNLNNNY